MSRAVTAEQMEKVKALFEAQDQQGLKFGPTYNGFRVESTYDFVKVNFALLYGLSEIFNTRDIDTDQYETGGGCETCDYGKSYRVKFVIGGGE